MWSFLKVGDYVSVYVKSAVEAISYARLIERIPKRGADSWKVPFFFFFTTLGLELSDTEVYEP